MSADDKNPGEDDLEDLEPTDSEAGEVKGGRGKMEQEYILPKPKP
jgi:hypothetical protein